MPCSLLASHEAHQPGRWRERCFMAPDTTGSLIGPAAATGTDARPSVGTNCGLVARLPVLYRLAATWSSAWLVVAEALVSLAAALGSVLLARAVTVDPLDR